MTHVQHAAPPPALLIGSVGGAALLLLAGATSTDAVVPYALAVLAGAAAFSLDEPAAAAVDAGPTSLRRRTATRCLAALVPLLTGALGLAAVGWQLPDLAVQPLLLALVVSVLLALALASALRRRIAAPGESAGSVIALGLVAAALFEPFSRWGVVLSGGAETGRTTLLLVVLAGASLVVLGWTTRDLLARLSRPVRGRGR